MCGVWGRGRREMLYQSCGHRTGATLLSGMRNGLLSIPLLLVLSSVRGLAGIQEAQPLSYVLSLPIAIPFIVRFFRNLPGEKGQPT